MSKDGEQRDMRVIDAIRAGRCMLKPVWSDIDFDHSDQATGVPAPEHVKPARVDALRIDLPPQEKWPTSQLTIVAALLARRSSRRFTSDSLSLQELSLLLHCTQGIRRTTRTASYRTVPSAGARHSFETYLYIDRVQGLDKGVYRYLPDRNQVILQAACRQGMETELNQGLLDQLYGAAVCFIWTAIPYRMEWRYSWASAKLVAIDAGHLCENLYLAVEAIGAGTCAIAAYDQTRMDNFLGVDGNDEFTVYAAPVGKIARGTLLARGEQRDSET